MNNYSFYLEHSFEELMILLKRKVSYPAKSFDQYAIEQGHTGIYEKVLNGYCARMCLDTSIGGSSQHNKIAAGAKANAILNALQQAYDALVADGTIPTISEEHDLNPSREQDQAYVRNHIRVAKRQAQKRAS